MDAPVKKNSIYCIKCRKAESRKFDLFSTKANESRGFQKSPSLVFSRARQECFIAAVEPRSEIDLKLDPCAKKVSDRSPVCIDTRILQAVCAAAKRDQALIIEPFVQGRNLAPKRTQRTTLLDRHCPIDTAQRCLTKASYENRNLSGVFWMRGVDLNHRPPGYEPDELPGCSTPRADNGQLTVDCQIAAEV